MKRRSRKSFDKYHVCHHLQLDLYAAERRDVKYSPDDREIYLEGGLHLPPEAWDKTPKGEARGKFLSGLSDWFGLEGSKSNQSL